MRQMNTQIFICIDIFVTLFRRNYLNDSHKFRKLGFICQLLVEVMPSGDKEDIFIGYKIADREFLRKTYWTYFLTKYIVIFCRGLSWGVILHDGGSKDNI